MATLSSPGVAVQVIDESFYSPAEPGTTPLIIVATAENKLNGAGTGTAPGTLKANADKVYLVTSQKDLVDTFGDPVFKTDANGNAIHAGEQNEYGLQAAYSFLGVSNRAFIARANLDLEELTATADAPRGVAENGTYWFDVNDSVYGIFEWNGNPITTKNGQSFIYKTPIIINDQTLVNNFQAGDYTPKASVGTIGSYAIVTVTTSNELYFKNQSGTWVLVGSNQWQKSWPTIAGTKFANTITPGDNFYLNGNLITAGSTLQSIADAINNGNIFEGAITAAVVNNKLEIYNDGSHTATTNDSSVGDSIYILPGTQGSLVAPVASNSVLGIATGIYYNPKLTISRHTQVPEYKKNNQQPRPTGALWIKTTKQNVGARWRVKRYNSSTRIWDVIEVGLYQNNQSAIYNLDKINGGLDIPAGDVYVNYNFTEDYGLDESPTVTNFKLMRRATVGETTIVSGKVVANTLTAGNVPNSHSFVIAESVLGSEVLGDYDKTGSYNSKIVSFQASGTVEDASIIAAAINATGFVNVYAQVDSLNRVVIKHRLGGDFRIRDGVGNPFTGVGFGEYNVITKTGTLHLTVAPDGDTIHDFVASLWTPLNYVASSDEPTTLTPDGKLWYSSIIDEVDIMINDGNKWVGYKTSTSPFYKVSEAEQTDPLGPIVSASTPTEQSDGTPLVSGDLWIDTGDIENFPMIYKYNAEYENKPIKYRWMLVDKTDQSTEDGIVFADARYNTAGENSDVAGDIATLLESNFVDFDAPDPVLYPKGMLLWNLRRSGFNVKKFVHNYINPSEDNPRFGPAPVYSGESQEFYYQNRWVTVSSNEEDGSGTFGRKAQRKVVVKQLQALVNSNQHMRDEESRVFNLIACPGYPELIGEMISLNYDRGLTAFVVGDTPARLTSDATSLLEWGTNVNLALEDNDKGAASYDEYMAMFYPWGYSSDNYGNNIAVPPSHMILRTIALNDQVAYPWFAPAGLRRGGITNATAVGYIDGEGEFASVALNNGQRDTLYDAKINPITFFANSGLVNFGQKTRARSASALDRINVARLIVYLRRRLSILAKPFIMEPNDKITRDELKDVVDGVMRELVALRAITDYLIVCDKSNNTPARIDRNELYVDIAIVPTKAVEFIYIPLRLKNTGSLG
jgi:hypothetical protein